MVREYSTIVHEDGLETAILGLDIKVSKLTFYDGEESAKDSRRISSNSIMLKLVCRSVVSTYDNESKTSEIHHSKTVSHVARGHYYSGNYKF